MPKIIDHDQRRSDIVDVTWDLIVRGGIEAATMREIAAAAGFANGALKLYFPSKEDIIAATYERALDMMRQYVELDGLRGLTALRELCVSSMPIDPERITAGRVLMIFWQMSLANRTMHDKYLEHVREWRGLLHRFLDRRPRRRRHRHQDAGRAARRRDRAAQRRRERDEPGGG